MQFAKAAWKILVGIKDGLVLIAILLFFGLLYAALSARPNGAAVADGALLLKLEGSVVEEPAEIALLDTLTGGSGVAEYRLRDVVHAIETAGGDERVKGIVLDLDGFLGGGQVSLSRIGEALDTARAAGKPVYAFASFYGDDAYQLAAHADEVWMDPMGGIVFAGPGGNRLYYKALLDKLGVTANVYRVGTYKSAVEPYIRTDMSDEAREAAQSLYDSLWEAYLAEIGRARPEARVAGYAEDPAGTIAAARGDLARVARARGLIDGTSTWQAFEDYIAKKAGRDEAAEPDGFAHTTLADYVAARPFEAGGAAIGVVTVAGEIVDGDAGPGVAAGGRIADTITAALERGDLSALVVRVDSPGGSAFASEEIRIAVARAKARGLPVVVSMGDVAASGGYWIASVGDAIFAEPTTITGSIGVFAVLPSFERAMDNIGVDADGVSTTPLSGAPDFVGGFSPEFNTILQLGVEESYRDFVTLVARARGKTPAEVDAMGQGRVWPGGTARQLGLVDRFGGLDDAVAHAARLAKLDDGEWHARYIDPPTGWFGFGAFGPFAKGGDAPVRDVTGWAAREQRAAFGAALSTARGLMSRQGVQALCLECGGAPRSSAANRDIVTDWWRSYFASSSLFSAGQR